MFKRYLLIREKVAFIYNQVKIYIYDIWRDIKYSNGFFRDDNETKLLTKIILDSHSIEKGLTMPNKRLGFGQAKILTLVKRCNDFKSQYSDENIYFMEVIGVIKEYLRFHRNEGFVLPMEVISSCEELVAPYASVKETIQPLKTSDQYFEYSNSSFLLFSNSRRSIRNFSGKISEESLFKAIELARNAPSTCNRQSIRVHIVKGESKKRELLKIQSGNRGFGDLAECLLILTSDLSAWEAGKLRHGPYMDGGIFTMNLLYSLHYYKIAACPLNLFLPVDKDKKLRSIIPIPDNEAIIVMIAIGSLPEQISIAHSARKSTQSIITSHN
jgi:nitroreductase